MLVQLFLLIFRYRNKQIKVMIRLNMSISRSRYFDNQKQLAEYLNIKNCSKKAIEARVRVLSMEVGF